MEVRLLGPVTVLDDFAVARPIASGRLRALVAALALRTGRPVTQDELIDLLWDSDPPGSARTTLHGYVHRLRSTAGPVVDTCDTGYTLADGVVVDASVLASDLGAASDALRDSRPDAVQLASTAVARRSGPPLVDLVGNYRFVAGAAARLDDLWIQAHEVLAESLLRTGAAAHAASNLSAVLDEHPYRERLWALLMRALYLDGRANEALAAYQLARTVFAEDLGLEPSPMLRQLEHDVLENAPHLISTVSLPGDERPSAPIDYVRGHTVQLAYRRAGTGPNVAIVCGTGSFLLPIAEPWMAALRSVASVLAFDPRGIGRSDPIVGSCALADRVADLIATLAAADMPHATLIAHNDGGAIAIAAAAAHPDIVDGIVFFNTWDRGAFIAHPNDFSINQRLYEATWGTGASLWAIGPTLRQDPAVRAALIEDETLVASPAQALAVNLAAQVDARPLIPQIKCPTVVLHTEDNCALPIGYAEKLAARLGAPLRRLPGENHFFAFDDPAPSIDAIVEFLAMSAPSD